MRRLFSFRTTTVILLVLIIAAVTYGFAAANTFAPSLAGEGEEAVTGFAISNIHYTLDVSSNPGTITTVTFTTIPDVPSGGTVYVVAEKITATAGEVVSQACTVTGASVSCPFAANALTVPFIESLRIIAAQ